VGFVKQYVFQRFHSHDKKVVIKLIIKTKLWIFILAVNRVRVWMWVEVPIFKGPSVIWTGPYPGLLLIFYHDSRAEFRYVCCSSDSVLFKWYGCKTLDRRQCFYVFVTSNVFRDINILAYYSQKFVIPASWLFK
jgi:hypothetical protein